jgi:hypothetical protein
MAKKRVREVVWEPPSADYLMEKHREGWTLVALEWEREAKPGELQELELGEEVPYGLRIADDRQTLVENPAEKEVLTAMLSLIIDDDFPFSKVAKELTARGYRNRDGQEWTQTAVFEMLPRLVETAPRIFETDQWIAGKRTGN